MQRSTPIKLAFPAKGTAQGTPLAEQAPDTCPNLRNVRLVDWRDRRGGGKRPGHSKALSGIAGTAANRRINGLSLYLPPTAVAATAATVVAIDQAFPSTGGFAVSANPSLDGNWILAQRMVEAASRWEAEVAGGNGGFAIDATSLQFGGNQSTLGIGLVCMFGTTNDVTVDVRATGQVAAGIENVIQECTRIGPGIRFENQGASGLFAWLRVRGNNLVRLEIVELTTAHGQTVRATGADVATNTLAALVTYTLRLRIDPATNLLTATCTGGLTSSVSASAADSLIYLGQTRGCVVCQPPSAVNNQSYRRVTRVALSKLVPQTPAIIQDAQTPVGAVLDWSATIGPGTFLVPAGAYARHQTRIGGADVASEAPPNDNVGAVDARPRVETALDNYSTTNFNQTTDRIYLAASNPPTPFPSVRFFLRPDASRAEVDPTGGGLGGGDSIGGMWYVSADRKAWVAVTNFTRRVGLTNPTDDGRLMSSLASNMSISCRDSTGNEAVIASAPMGGPSANFPGVLLRRDAPTATVPQLNVWSFDGTTIALTVNGLTMQTFTLNYADGVYGATLTAIRNNTGFGMSLGTANQVAGAAANFGGYIVSPVPPAIDYSQFRAQILEASVGAFTIGDLVADTQTPVVGDGLYGALPQMTVAFGKWYCCDGYTYRVVDPVTAVSTAWVATLGTLPVGARYICTYRGRVVLAVGTVWYMSRAGDPLDWQYGTSPLSTSAYNGNDANYGGPADVITGLIPFGDDFLLIMCAGSIWRMDGDPGYQGLLTCLTRKTGMLGPRAWCFDEKGNLYFLGGGGGLYVLPRGATEPLNVSEESMATFFDRQDFATNLVQMGYHAFRREVRIYLTNGDGTTNNVHAVYRPSDGAYWLDTIPIRFGPWAVCDGLGTKFYNRSVLLGGADGFLRQPDPRRNDDDADAIDAWIEFGPFQLSDGQEESMATELQAMIGAGSEPLTWYWFTARSPEEVAAQDFPAAVATGTFNTPPEVAFNTPVGLRQAGGAHKLRIRSNTASGTWALEQIVAYLRPTSRRRSSSAQV